MGPTHTPLELKLEPVRLIEAHMAGLQQEFGDWLEDAPEEPESVRPTEEQIFRYEQADKAHSARVSTSCQGSYGITLSF